MADTHVEELDIKFTYAFNDEGDSKFTITLPNPLPSVSEIKAELAEIESLAVDNRLLIGNKFRSQVSKMDAVKIINRVETGLDWRT